jgi:tetratricopeptide (TPR) repeat protein
MFCKEFVVTLPLILTLYDFYFLDALAEPWWKRCSRIVPFFAIALIVPLLLLRTPREAVDVANIADSHFIQEGDLQRVGSHIDITKANGAMGRKEYFLTELNVVCTYVRLLFLPVNQNFDYDYPISHIMDGKTLMSGAFLLCLLVLAAVMYKSYRIISFSILWFFIALSVESSFIPIGHVIAEYRLYLASVGFVFLATNLIYMRKADQKQLNIIAAVILVGFSMMTYQRNKVWRGEFTLWNDAVQKSPHKARPYNNRGVIFSEQGNFTQAISDYTKAIEIDPNFADAYINRGLVYYNQKNFPQGISDFTKAIETDTNYAEAYYGRGLVYEVQNNFAQAVADFTQAIEISPNYALAHYDRGRTYYLQNNFIQAISDFTKVIETNPHNATAYYFRGLAYEAQNNFARAIPDYTKAIEINPNYAEACYNRGLAYAQQGEFTQTISDLTKAIGINPNYAEAYYNRGTAYDRQKNFTRAISDYTEVIKRNLQRADAYNNRGYVYSEQGKFTQAITDLNKAIEINSKFAEAYNNRGFVYFKEKEYDKAWADVHKAETLGYRPDKEDLEFLDELKQASGKDK